MKLTPKFTHLQMEHFTDGRSHGFDFSVGLGAPVKRISAVERSFQAEAIKSKLAAQIVSSVGRSKVALEYVKLAHFNYGVDENGVAVRTIPLPTARRRPKPSDVNHATKLLISNMPSFKHAVVAAIEKKALQKLRSLGVKTVRYTVTSENTSKSADYKIDEMIRHLSRVAENSLRERY